MKKLHLAGTCQPAIPILTTPQKLCPEASFTNVAKPAWRLSAPGRDVRIDKFYFATGEGGGKDNTLQQPTAAAAAAPPLPPSRIYAKIILRALHFLKSGSAKVRE